MIGSGDTSCVNVPSVFRNRIEVAVEPTRSEVTGLNADFAFVRNAVKSGATGGVAAAKPNAGAPAFAPDDFGEDGFACTTDNGGTAVTDSDLAFDDDPNTGKPEHDDKASTTTTATATGTSTRDLWRKKDTLNSHRAHPQPDTPSGPMPS